MAYLCKPCDAAVCAQNRTSPLSLRQNVHQITVSRAKAMLLLWLLTSTKHIKSSVVQRSIFTESVDACPLGCRRAFASHCGPLPIAVLKFTAREWGRSIYVLPITINSNEQF